MNRRSMHHDALAREFRALADEEARVETPPRVAAAIMAEWDKHRAAAAVSKRRPHARTFVRGAATMAAGVTIVGAIALEHELGGGRVVLPDPPVVSFGAPDAAVPAPRVETTIEAGGGTGRAIDRRENGAGSTLVLIGAPIGQGELVQIVRMRVARSALAPLGMAETVSTDTVEIDVIVGEDGVARGMRVPL